MGVWKIQHPNNQADKYVATIVVIPKDPVNKENVVGPVYKIKCEKCEATYIGKWKDP